MINAHSNIVFLAGLVAVWHVYLNYNRFLFYFELNLLRMFALGSVVAREHIHLNGHARRFHLSVFILHFTLS